MNFNFHNFEKKKDIQAINDQVLKLHDIKYTKEYHVYELYSDGEILTTKGGELYGDRTFFSDMPAMILPEFTFPIKNKNLSYAVMTCKDARMMRKKMTAFCL